MKKFFILTLVTIIIGLSHNISVFAQCPANTNQVSQNVDLKNLNTFLDKFLAYSNSHNVDKLKNLYAQNYVSYDSLTKNQLMELTKDSWKNYPDLKYSSDIRNIRINENFAAIESYDKNIGSTAKKSDITDDTGIIESCSHNITYLQRFGKEWKIISDRVNFEKTIIKYGTAKNLNADLSAPEQVFSGEDYTVRLSVEVPDGKIAIAAIAREPIVYPQTQTEQIFRQVPPSTGILERVMKANKTNNNELASASVGYTEMIQNIYANPDVKLTGIALLLVRVNVIPKSSYVPEDKAKSQVNSDFPENCLPEQQDNKDLKKKND